MPFEFCLSQRFAVSTLSGFGHIGTNLPVYPTISRNKASPIPAGMLENLLDEPPCVRTAFENIRICEPCSEEDENRYDRFCRFAVRPFRGASVSPESIAP